MTGNHFRECKMQNLINNTRSHEFQHVRKKIKDILTKKPADVSPEEKKVLKQYKNIVKLVQSQKRTQILRKQREMEVEDDIDLLKKKCLQLAELMKTSKNIVLYTGAGISTSASIPDYRGPNGVWTKIKNGQENLQVNDLVFSEPTFTHMAIAELVKRKVVKHVVSQNCDGLHLRSGVPQECLSEIHGNIYLEVCRNCKTLYTRTFDVTEKTALRRHETGRKCHHCPPDVGKLIDTIVHFGEKGKLKYPLNWETASKSAEESDLIICIGSSLKILRRYACLWPKNKKKLRLVIVNLQWTPKDSQATIKINGKCDQVMKELMPLLNIPVNSYERTGDFVLGSSFPLKQEEEETCNRVKLEQLFKNQFDYEKITMTPAWFGKGFRKGLKKK